MFVSTGFRKGSWLLVVFILLGTGPAFGQSLTLHDAIALAKKRLSAYRASRLRMEAGKERYKASFAPYLPSLDVSYRQDRDFQDLTGRATHIYEATLSYVLYDWGRRKADRRLSKLDFLTDTAQVRSVLLDLELDVKNAYYTVLARREILSARRVQLRDAKKDYDVAVARKRYGMARLSDVLQASVRYEQARFDLNRAKGEYRKAVSELNSLIGIPFDRTPELEGSLDFDRRSTDWRLLCKAALSRPEILQAEYAVDRARTEKRRIWSEFLPTFSAEASYSRIDDRDPSEGIREEKTAELSATWNVFELGKFYRKRSLKIEERASTQDLHELKRQIRLEVFKNHEDLVTAMKNVEVARKQLRESRHNYAQALGEYRAGKGDILSLVQAEERLAAARIQLATARLEVLLSKSSLERAVGIESLERFARSQTTKAKGEGIP